MSTLAPTRERESFGDVSEAAEFVQMLEKFERGEINSEQYRHYRLSRGIYGQRQPDIQMVRVKIPQGVLSAAQLRVLAELATRWSRGYGHVTTRQNLQLHNVKVENVPPLLEALANAGLTTREACSHTVRNVAACAYAGVCGDAPFDITPYAEAVTRHFLRSPLGSGLPRKFKITASGCEDDCTAAAMNDIGFVARVEHGERGFRFLAGGGTATLPRTAKPLHDFLPAEHLLVACEAVVRVFNVEGERGNLHKARLKWAIQRLGWDGFKAKYLEQYQAILAEGGRPLPGIPPEEGAPVHPKPVQHATLPVSPAYLAWKHHNVRAQAQAGYVAPAVWLRLGDISSEQLIALADLAAELGDGTVRTTVDQNLVMRWVREGDLRVLWERLDVIGLGGAQAGRISDVTSCPGAETCRIAVTASRGVAQLVGDHLRAKDSKATADIKVSGCPNGCGQNHISAIGLQGGVRKLGERLVPQYHLTLGGGVDREGAKFGRLVAKIPARRVPEAIDRLIADYESNRHPDETARRYFQRVELDWAKKLIADLAALTEATARPEDFVDLGSSVQFQVEAMDGECAV
ncbi:MAG: nitrite/sulfite reductase [Myxococcaceae bacterium]